MQQAKTDDATLWYKDAIIYELHVRAFADSNGDGVGDFRGLTQRLEYLQDLGVTTIWLLPFYPSPLRDDGYDIADYTDIHPRYGTLDDFRLFLREAHRRGLRVITELVINHTSDQHPWFQRARRAPPGSPERDFYVWNDTAARYEEARVIFQDFETSNWAWDPVAKAYYWHRFYSHQPDLNYDNPAVWEAVFAVLDFWLELGVDGMRLDAVPYLFEREGTSCENLPETHAFLKALRKRVDERFPGRMFLAEANQWPEDAASYFGNGDECHVAFHFPLMPRLFMAIRREDRFPILDILAQTPPIPDNCQWALFLRNHDELTLEMVTDEERGYMCRAYASDPQARINLGIRRRLAPLLENHRRGIELMNALLFSLPGTPVLYYGDEIGMGDNIYLGDRNGVRTPMQWSADQNAGFSRANPQQLYLPVIIDPEYHYQAVNVRAQEGNPHSLLSWMKRLIALRKRSRPLGRGTLELLAPGNHRVLAYLRRFVPQGAGPAEEERILVVANLSRFAQHVELDLSAFEGMAVTELFGNGEFPLVGSTPYSLTLGPHSFFFFSLEPRPAPAASAPAASAGPNELPVLAVRDGWEEVLGRRVRPSLEAALPGYLRSRVWFGGRSRPVAAARIEEVSFLPESSPGVYFALVRVEYWEGDPETYALPLTFASGEDVQKVLAQSAWAAIATIRFTRVPAGSKVPEADGLLYDALASSAFCDDLLKAVARGSALGDGVRAIRGCPEQAAEVWGDEDLPQARLAEPDPSNSLVFYGSRFVLKVFRRLEPGVHPEREVLRFLNRRGFAQVPPLFGALEYRGRVQGPIVLGIVEGYVQHKWDGGRYTEDALARFIARARAAGGSPPPVSLSPSNLLTLARGTIAGPAREWCGPYLTFATLLGQRTAEVHAALGSDHEDPSFTPKAFTMLYQRSLYQSLRNLTGQALRLLGWHQARLDERARAEAGAVLASRDELLACFAPLLKRKVTGWRLRCHSDYQLGQVLWTGSDVVLIDWEGDPSRPLEERRLKASPLRDVAGMLHSFHSAGYRALAANADGPVMEQWVRFWCAWASAAFLGGYLGVAEAQGIVPGAEETELLAGAHLLERALYRLVIDLENHPERVWGTLREIRERLEANAPAFHAPDPPPGTEEA